MSELSIIKIIILGLQHLNLYYVADIFLIISIALFSAAIYKQLKIATTLLSLLGIFTTILTISIGISQFDNNTIEISMPILLDGLAIAFIFGFINFMLVLVLQFLSKSKAKKPDTSEITPTAIYLTLREISTYNNVTQKPLLISIFEQLRLSQENNQRILQLQETNVYKELDLLKNIKNIVEKNDIELGAIIDQQDSGSNHELIQSLQELQQYLKNLQQLHTQANDTFPRLEQSLTELTEGMQQVLQNNLELLENSIETQLDMVEATKALKDSESSGKLRTAYDQAFSYMDSGEYKNAITYFSQAIELNPQEFSLFYNQSCCYAMLGEVEPSLEVLSDAILLNEECIEMANNDLDFNKIRYNPKFQSLLNKEVN